MAKNHQPHEQVVSNVAQKAFSAASNYENVRADYPVEAVELFLDNLGVMKTKEDHGETKPRPFTILEVGCGTGKFTQVMLKVLEDKNVRVIASEPLQSMYEHFKVMVPDAEIIQCTAENIALPDSSVDAVIAASCFHWFANRAACEEIHRVLKPSGTFGIIWSLEDRSVPWVKNLYEFIDTLHKENSLVFPDEEKWKALFGQLSYKLFSAPNENVSFKQSFPSSFEQAYNYYASFSAIAGGSERNKKDFKECFDNVIEKHFIADGIPLRHVPIHIYMYWCTKETEN